MNFATPACIKTLPNLLLYRAEGLFIAVCLHGKRWNIVKRAQTKELAVNVLTLLSMLQGFELLEALHKMGFVNDDLFAVANDVSYDNYRIR